MIEKRYVEAVSNTTENNIEWQRTMLQFLW